MARWGDEVVVFPVGKPPADYVTLIAKGMERAKEAVSSGEYDVVVLDEYVMALFFGLISREDTEDLLAHRSPKTELILPVVAPLIGSLMQLIWLLLWKR